MGRQPEVFQSAFDFPDIIKARGRERKNEAREEGSRITPKGLSGATRMGEDPKVIQEQGSVQP